MTDQRYRTRITTAKSNLNDSIAYSLLVASEDEEVHHNYAVDPKAFPTRAALKEQRLRLLGHHIERLAASLEMDREEVVSAALELSGE